MNGCLDQINRETISGWIFGDLKNLKVEIDGQEYCPLDIEKITRKDVLGVYPNTIVSGFSFKTPPLIVNDGRLHAISLKIN